MDFNRQWTPFALDAEVEHFGTSRIAAAHNDLRAEVERLRADAERYRWLRGDGPLHDERWSRWNLQRWDGRCWHSLERSALDAAIDAARTEGKG